MIINKWDTDCRENDNVSVNDGVVTYFAEWDLEDGPIEFDAVAEDYKDGAYYDDEEAEVTVEVTNLLTGASEYHELVWGEDGDEDDDEDEDDADDDEDEDDDEEGEE